MRIELLPMPEIWLRNNTRVLWLAGIVPAVVAMAGFLIAAGCFGLVSSAAVRCLAAMVAALGGLLLVNLVWQARRPRLAYDEGCLLVYLRGSGPLRVPIDVVEGFLLGRAPSHLPGKKYERTETAAVVIRLAERAEEWAMVEVRPSLGSWCGHYVTIRGTWCEPLSVDLVNKLNARLAAVKQQGRQRQAVS